MSPFMTHNARAAVPLGARTHLVSCCVDIRAGTEPSGLTLFPTWTLGAGSNEVPHRQGVADSRLLSPEPSGQDRSPIPDYLRLCVPLEIRLARNASGKLAIVPNDAVMTY